MNYNLVLLTDNIFDELYIYKIRCIGKQISRNMINNQITRYFFLSHRKKIQVTEKVTERSICEITIEEVSDFTLKEEYNSYLFTNVIENDEIQNVANEYVDFAYHKDGFYVFKQIVEKNGYPYIGGIVDLYEFDNCSFDKIKEEIKKAS